MKNVIVFDLDDTLYLRSDPYLAAVRQVFGSRFDDRSSDLLRTSRHHSYIQYNRRCRGEIDYDEMIRRRTVDTFAVFDCPLSDDDAYAFETVYVRELNNISVRPVMAEILAMIREKGHVSGLITNGPGHRQREKIARLGLASWISPDLWVISQEVGCEKPDEAIFRLFEEKGHFRPEQCWMVGDHFENDIQGALKAGWHGLYLKREAEQTADVPKTAANENTAAGTEIIRSDTTEAVRQPDFSTVSEAELKAFLEKICRDTKNV